MINARIRFAHTVTMTKHIHTSFPRRKEAGKMPVVQLFNWGCMKSWSGIIWSESLAAGFSLGRLLFFFFLLRKWPAFSMGNFPLRRKVHDEIQTNIFSLCGCPSVCIASHAKMWSQWASKDCHRVFWVVDICRKKNQSETVDCQRSEKKKKDPKYTKRLLFHWTKQDKICKGLKKTTTAF